MGGPSASGKSTGNEVSPEEQFARNLAKNLTFSPFDNGTPEQIANLNLHTKKFIDSLSAEERAIVQQFLGKKGGIRLTTEKSSYYDPSSNKVYINSDRLAKEGTTLIAHEMGHAFDYNGVKVMGSYASEKFYDTLKTEGESIKSMMKQGGVEANALRNILNNSSYDIGSFQDIVGAATGNKVRGTWGHSNSYYDGQIKSNHTSEVFANVSAMKYNSSAESKAAYGYMEKYFPKTLSAVNKIYDSITKKANK